MAKTLFTTFGSYGDVHPYLAIGKELQRRGHSVTIATSEAYRAKVLAQGLSFHPVRPDLTLTDADTIAQFFDARRGSERVIRFISAAARKSFDDTLPALEETDLLVTQIMSLAAMAGVEKLKKPWISTVLAPSSLLSAVDPPVLPQAPWLIYFRIFGPGVMRRLFAVGKRESRLWLEELLSLRTSLGLSVREHPFFEGANSPLKVLALFSRHLTLPPRDWPIQTSVTGFPFFVEPEATGRLDSFFGAGAAPLAFTLGSSAVNAAGDFYRTSLEVAARLKMRAILFAGSIPQGLPNDLPDSVIAVAYEPFAQILPRCAAIIHQGGIGTTAEAMRAGRPMLVAPLAHDQFDNAERVRRLGIAKVLPRSRYTVHRAAEKLHQLLKKPEYGKAAERVGAEVREEKGVENAADEIEAVLRTST